MAVSISHSDFAPTRLVCLAGSFRRRFVSQNNITILIFSSADAAKRYVPYQPEFESAKGEKQQKLQSHSYWVEQLHGFYSFNSQKNEEYIDLRPQGSERETPYDTRIDLPAVTTPKCRVELSGRCLLAMERYPIGGLKLRASSSFILQGVLTRDGRMTGIRSSNTDDIAATDRNYLVHEAITYLKTWHFESAQREDAFRISFAYVIDPLLAERNAIDVKLALPDQVTIRGNPPIE